MYPSSYALLRKNILPTRQQNQRYRVLQNRYDSFLHKNPNGALKIAEKPWYTQGSKQRHKRL